MGEVEARPHLEAGEEFLRREVWREAEDAFRRAVAAFPDSPIAWSKLGVALAHQGRHDEAIDALRRAIQLNPRYAAAYSNLGNVYREQKRYDEALRAYEQAVEIDPEYWVAHQNLGVLYKQLGRVTDSVRELKKATRLSMKSGSGASRRGCLGPMATLIAAGIALGAWILRPA